MKVLRLVLLLTIPAAVAAPISAYANDFPTTGRVEYVLECMKNHAGKYEYLYKCSCALDNIATSVKYDEFVEISLAARPQMTGGQRGSEFRDPEIVKTMAKKFKTIQAAADQACFVQ
ncbi:hypothetical protein HAV38_07585 [Glaciimonas immobilis]|nr:hypothetical protein HAV38_07585 [Glaciimonas immobilis]